MTRKPPAPRPAQPNLVDIYHAAQQIQHVNRAPTPPKDDGSDRADRTHDVPTGRASAEFRKHPTRYTVAGLAAAALMGFVLQPHVQAITSEVFSGQNGDTTILIGDVNGNGQEDAEPTGDPEKITFSSLLGDKLEMGSLLMTTTGGNGQIVFTRSDGSSGNVLLPNVAHQQNIELSARPFLISGDAQKFLPESPITVTPKDDGYLVSVDRGKIAIIFNYAMHGTYTATHDQSSKATTVALKPEDNRDIAKIGFLATSAKPLSAKESGLSSAEIGRINTLATATEQIAATEAKIMSLKQSAKYIDSATANECYAQPTDEAPTDTRMLITEKVDMAIQQALEQWALTNHRMLYLEKIGEYPLDSAAIYDQYLVRAAEGDEKAKENARDIETIMTNHYADYFGITDAKITCAPDDALKSAK